MKDFIIEETSYDSEVQIDLLSVEVYTMPNEACCSPEFSEGCIFIEPDPYDELNERVRTDETV